MEKKRGRFQLQKQMLSYVKQQRTTTSSQIADHFEISISLANRVVGNLMRTGSVHRISIGRKSLICWYDEI